MKSVIIARTAIGPIHVGGAAGYNDHGKWWFGVVPSNALILAF